jgi:hypothetical protein
VLLVAPATLAQLASSQTVKVPDGTQVPLVLMDDLDSKWCKRGDPVRFKVKGDIAVDGIVVIPAGTMARGHIESAKRRGFAGRSGKLGFSVDFLTAPDGTQIPLTARAKLKGGSNTAVTAAATAVYGPGALLTRGADADIRKGTVLNAYVDGEHAVTLSSVTVPSTAEGSAQVTSSPSGPTSPALRRRLAQIPPQHEVEDVPSSERSSVLLKSTPDGADIIVDGTFEGNTPSILRLSPGEHVILIDKPGFLPWRRSITVPPGSSPTVDAELVKSL